MSRTAEPTLERRWADAAGYSFSWERDYDAEHRDRGGEWRGWPQYWCAMRDKYGNTVQSLGGVMFADRGDPDDDPYSLEIENDLAAAEMAEIRSAGRPVRIVVELREPWDAEPLDWAETVRAIFQVFQGGQVRLESVTEE